MVLYCRRSTLTWVFRLDISGRTSFAYIENQQGGNRDYLNEWGAIYSAKPAPALQPLRDEGRS